MCYACSNWLSTIFTQSTETRLMSLSFYIVQRMLCLVKSHVLTGIIILSVLVTLVASWFFVVKRLVIYFIKQIENGFSHSLLWYKHERCNFNQNNVWKHSAVPCVSTRRFSFFSYFFSFFKNRKPDSKLSLLIQTSHIAPWENECKVKNEY